LSSESATPQTIWGRGDKSALCRKKCATSKLALRVGVFTVF
jgi:hypothetical protein